MKSVIGHDVFGGSKAGVAGTVSFLLAALLAVQACPLEGQAQATDGPQEALRLFGMDQSTMRQFIDGKSLNGDEHEPLFRLLYLMPRFDSADLMQWRRPFAEATQSLNQPEQVRGEIFQLRGWVTDIGEMEIPRESASRFDYERIYTVRMTPLTGEYALTVFARQIPQAWRRFQSAEEAIEIPAGCDAMFAKTGAKEESRVEIVFATHRFAWYPNEVDLAMGVRPGKALLGQGGMDISQFDELDQAKPIGHNDRECFYQMLWVMERLDDAAMLERAQASFDIARLLKQPAKEAGQFYDLQGLARRAVEVRVDDDDIRQKYGIDHYYEVDVFLSLPIPLSLVDPRDGETRGYDKYPVTFCVRELPPDMPRGTSIRQEVRVCASYMKTWSYRSRFMTGEERRSRRRQVSPLFIGRTVQTISPPHQRTHWPETILVGGFLGALAVIACAGWFYSRGDKAYAQRRRSRPDRLSHDL